MLKSVLICIAALAILDGVAFHGEYRDATIHKTIQISKKFFALDWNGFVHTG